jgi:MFS family permease
MSRPRQALAAVRFAVRNVDVRRAELAWGAAIAAEWAHFVAFGVFAYGHGGAAAVGLAGVVRLLPAAIVAPFAASLGDRFPRERFLLAVTMLGAVALAASAIAYTAGTPAAVFAFAAVLGIAITLIRPALQALLPSLACSPEELIASNGATSTIEGLGTLVGPLLAGALVAVVDAGVVFAVASAGLVVAALLLLRIKAHGALAVSSTVESEDAVESLAAGFRAILVGRRTRVVVGLIAAQTFVRGCLNVLIVVAAFRVFDTGAEAVGYMTAAIGVGGLVGALGAMTLSDRKLAASFGGALVFWGLPLVLIAPSPDLAIALVLLAVVGAANAVEDVAVFTLIQRLVPDRVLTRVLGIVWSLAMGTVALGSLAAPALVSAIGPRAAFAAVGVLLPALTMTTYRTLTAIDREVRPAEGLGLVEAVPMFAPLSVAAKERVAAHLVPVSVHAGDLVIRAGDTADCFYIVDSGALDIDADGVHRTARETDFFGEIALLRRVPRTATVTALADTRLYALDRDDFLAAVTGHKAAHAAGEAVARERLAAAAGS